MEEEGADGSPQRQRGGPAASPGPRPGARLVCLHPVEERPGGLLYEVGGGVYPSQGDGERGCWFRDSEDNLIGIGQPTAPPTPAIRRVLDSSLRYRFLA